MSEAKCVRVIYTKRFPLAPYSHEEFTVEYFLDENCKESGKEALLRARSEVAQSSELYLKAMKEKEGKK